MLRKTILMMLVAIFTYAGLVSDGFANKQAGYSTGFGDVHWGIHASKQFTFVKEDSKTLETYYTRKKQAPVYFESNRADAVLYVFSFDNRFYRVVLKFGANSGYEELKRILAKLFGNGRAISRDYVRWENETVVAELFRDSQARDISYVTISSKKEIDKTRRSIEAAQKALGGTDQKDGQGSKSPWDSLILK
jgi:hypothetical protein